MKHNVIFRLEQRKGKDGRLISKNVPVRCDITFTGTRVCYYPGFRVDADKFEGEKVTKNATAKHGNLTVQYSFVNERLKLIKAELLLYFANRQEADKDEIKDLLDRVCSKAKETEQTPTEDNFYQAFDEFLDGVKMGPVRARQIRSIKNHWQRFDEYRKKQTTFENIDVDTVRAFDKYLQSSVPRPKSKYSNEVINSKRGKNTTINLLSLTRAVWNRARELNEGKGLILPDLFGRGGFKLPRGSFGKPIYITREERDQLFLFQAPNERLSRVRDVFIFQCLTGCRVGDLMRLTKANIQGGTLTYIQHKTKNEKPTPVNVPLHDQAKEILSRYNLPGGKILPFISEQKYNEYLKELFELAGIVRTVTRLNPTTGNPEQVRICDIASSHMARRAFVGNLYGKVDSGIIASMSGHSKTSRAFARYFDVSEELQKNAINIL